jgi:hypothetical protein
MLYSVSGTIWCFSYSMMYYGDKVLGYFGGVMSCSRCSYTVYNTCKKLKSKFSKKPPLLWSSENEWKFHELRAKSQNSSNRCKDLGLLLWKESSRYWEWDELTGITVSLFNPSYLSSYHCNLLLNYCNGVYHPRLWNSTMSCCQVTFLLMHITVW